MLAKMSVRFIFITVSIFLAGYAYAQTGQILDEFGASCKSVAMGQAFTAVADDFSASYYNPAGLTQVESPFALTMGYFYAKPRVKAIFELEKDQASNITDQLSSHGAIIGLASSLDIAGVIKNYPWFKPLALGMVYWLNLPEMMQYHAGPEGYRPHFFRYDDGFALMSMVASLAYEITPWLSVGAGAFVANKGYSTQELWLALNKSDILQQILGFQPPFVHVDEVKGSRVGIHTTTVAFAVPTAGLIFKPPFKSLQDKISLGVCWRAQSKMHHGRGPLVITTGFEDENGDPIDKLAFAMPVLYMLGVVGFQPTQVTGGLAFKEWPFSIEGLTMSFDLTWKDYSKMVDYLEETPEPPFEDTFVPRVGIEYAIAPHFSNIFIKWIDLISVRGGYFFEPTPAKGLEEPHSHNMYDTDMDVVSAGLQLDFTSRQGRLHHSIEGYFQAHLLRERNVAKHETIWVNPFTGQGEPASYFGPVTLSGQVWSFGVSFTTRY